jgi:hypothetical protein
MAGRALLLAAGRVEAEGDVGEVVLRADGLAAATGSPRP